MGPMPALIWPLDFRGDPAAIKVSGLGLHLFGIDITGIHEAGIEGNVVADGFVALMGLRITPGCVFDLPVAHPDMPVMRGTFKFAL